MGSVRLAHSGQAAGVGGWWRMIQMCQKKSIDLAYIVKLGETVAKTCHQSSRRRRHVAKFLCV